MRHNLVQFKAQNRHSKEAVHKAEKEIAEINLAIKRIAGKDISQLLQEHQTSSTSASASFAAGLEQVSNAFSQMAGLHEEAAAKLGEVVLDLEGD